MLDNNNSHIKIINKMNTQRQCIKGKDEVIKEKIRNIDLMNK